MLIGLILGVSVGIIAIVTTIYVLVKKYKARRVKEEIKKEINGSRKEHKEKIIEEAKKELNEDQNSLDLK